MKDFPERVMMLVVSYKFLWVVNMIGFWIFMLVMNLLLPLVMIGFGGYFHKNTPKEINNCVGYRTTMSKKSQDTWEFAHHFCGKLWLVNGFVLLPLTVIAMLFVFGKDISVVGNLGLAICLIQLIPLTVTVMQTERALKKTFDNNGRRRIT